jgi:hypothetical protein
MAFVAAARLKLRAVTARGLGGGGARGALRPGSPDVAWNPARSLLLAQHRDDQAETLLLRLLRGAGPDGLAAMAPVPAPRGRASCCGPLLDAFAQRRSCGRRGTVTGCDWVEDPGNAGDGPL